MVMLLCVHVCALTFYQFDFASDEFIYYIFLAWTCKVHVLVYWIADFKVKIQNMEKIEVVKVNKK